MVLFKAEYCPFFHSNIFAVDQGDAESINVISLHKANPIVKCANVLVKEFLFFVAIL